MSLNPGKTKIMSFSNTGNIYNLVFSFNGKTIPFSISHKHLGVILSQNARWNEHLENMITNIAKHLGTDHLTGKGGGGLWFFFRSEIVFGQHES